MSETLDIKPEIVEDTNSVEARTGNENVKRMERFAVENAKLLEHLESLETSLPNVEKIDEDTVRITPGVISDEEFKRQKDIVNESKDDGEGLANDVKEKLSKRMENKHNTLAQIRRSFETQNPDLSEEELNSKMARYIYTKVREEVHYEELINRNEDRTPNDIRIEARERAMDDFDRNTRGSDTLRVSEGFTSIIITVPDSFGSDGEAYHYFESRFLRESNVILVRADKEGYADKKILEHEIEHTHDPLFVNYDELEKRHDEIVEEEGLVDPLADFINMQQIQTEIFSWCMEPGMLTEEGKEEVVDILLNSQSYKGFGTERLSVRGGFRDFIRKRKQYKGLLESSVNSFARIVEMYENTPGIDSRKIARVMLSNFTPMEWPSVVDYVEENR